MVQPKNLIGAKEFFKLEFNTIEEFFIWYNEKIEPYPQTNTIESISVWASSRHAPDFKIQQKEDEKLSSTRNKGS